jgi:probable rRNA maturation factor
MSERPPASVTVSGSQSGSPSARAIAAQIAIEISDTQGHLSIDTRALVRRAQTVLALENRLRASISIALVDNATIRDLNRAHLGHDWPTDVISFPLSGPDEPVLAGELVVSAEMARAVAEAAGADPEAELALYVVHGLLHLCGYDDRDPVSSAAMRRRESEVLAILGLQNSHPPAAV